MTVREATQRESPDGHVLYIEELRKYLGVRFDAGEGSTLTDVPKARPEVLLIGHDMHGDFQHMERDGIDLQRFFHYSGCVDTRVIVDDTDAISGKSLSSVMSYYGLAGLQLKKPGCSKLPAKFEYVGSHCAGNDAVATLRSAVAQALDLSLRSSRFLAGEGNPPGDWLDKPLQGMNTNMTLLAYDTEAVETPNYKPMVLNRTSEHGFAWLHIAEIAQIAPGENGCNWKPFIRARHWINQDFHNFKNWFYCVGNPKGFWPEYGESRYYRVSEGPAPFHRLFEELANTTTGDGERTKGVEEVTSLLEKTSVWDSSSVPEDPILETRRRLPSVRGSFMGGRGAFRGGNRGWTPDVGEDSAPHEIYTSNNRGRRARGRGLTTSGRGRTPDVGEDSAPHDIYTSNNRGRRARGRGYQQAAEAGHQALGKTPLFTKYIR